MESINNLALGLTKVGSKQTKAIKVYKGKKQSYIHSDLKRDLQVSIESKKS